MDTPDSDRFDIFFAGECLDGFDAAAVRAALGALFRADDATLARLFSGKRQRIKAAVDEATARRYQLAMRRAGARAIVTRAAAPAEGGSPAAAKPGAAPATALSLAPPGSDVLGAHERPRVDATPPSTAHLSVADPGEDLTAGRAEAAAAVSVPDLDLASPGSNLASHDPSTPPPPPPPPDLSALSLADPDHDLSDCARHAHDAFAPRTEHLSVAPPGGDLVSEAERSRPEPLSPRTDHLRLADDEDA